jgi:hypothetical protein
LFPCFDLFGRKSQTSLQLNDYLFSNIKFLSRT